MSKQQDRMIAGFTAGERGYIRREVELFFFDIAKRCRGFSPQDLARGRRCRQAEAAVDSEGVDHAWPHAA
jgi:hypothetical protein